jgi:myo-inositol-1(or 4)-monophosphatase
MGHSLADELALLRAAAEAAGTAALAFFNPGKETSASVSFKEGNSPVSEADHAANAALESKLREARPGYHWISEETADDSARLTASHVFIVDPIDGTRAFIAGRLQWCVSAALSVDGVAVAGVIHAPALGMTYAATQGGGAFLNGRLIGVSRRAGLSGALAAGPKSALEQLERAAGHSVEHGPRIPSLALRLALAAEGKIDLAIASTGAHDWDVAAADIILREAGGVLLDLDQKQLVYNRSSLRRGMLCAGPGGLVAAAMTAFGLRS